MKSFLDKMEDYFDIDPNFWDEPTMAYWEDVGPLMIALEHDFWGSRRVVHAPLLDDTIRKSGHMRIKAVVDSSNPAICHFMLDRPVLMHYSAWFGAAREAAHSPLALALFGVKGIEEAVFHHSIIHVRRAKELTTEWHTTAVEIGGIIRRHFETGGQAVDDDFIRRIPSEQVIMEQVQQAITMRINPTLHQHDHPFRLEGIENNTIWIDMGDRCPDCEAAPFSVRNSATEVLRKAVPALGAIYDAADPSAGVNPFFHTTSPGEEESQ